LLRRGENEKRSRGARSSVRLFFFICLLLAGFEGRVFSQDLGTLADQLHSGNTEEKRTVLMQLRSLRSEEASRVAVAALKDKNPMVRATAASSVTFLPPAEAAAALLPLIGDKDEFVRQEGAYALGVVGDISSAPQLTKALTSDKSPEVKTAAAVALGKVGDPRAVPALLKEFDQRPTEDNEMLRRAAARSIGQIAEKMRSGKVSVVTPQNFLPEKFKDLGSKPTPDLLAHFTQAVKSLIAILESSAETDDTRREAAFALGAIGDRSAEPVLSKYTSSPDPYLAEISKEALLKLKAGE
jgi:HEAT repeat protein